MGGFGPGCLLIRAEGDVVRFINACAAEGVSVQRFCSTDGISFFYIPARQWRQAKMLAERCGAVLTIREQDGVSYILLRYRKRIGLVIWPVLAIGLLLFSQCFLWAIDINGCEEIEPSVILRTAEEAGLYKGRFLPACDMKAVAGHILELPGVGFCAVNKIGSRVEIEINEVAQTPVVLPSDPCSIVAAETGQIVYMEVYGGQETVKVGEAVGKGQLLINGITESPDGKTRYVHADAKVIADAVFSHDFTLDLHQVEKTYTGEITKRYSLELLGGRVPLYLPDRVLAFFGSVKDAAGKAAGFLFDGPEPDPEPAPKQEVLWESETSRAPLTILGVQLPIGLQTETRSGYTKADRVFTEAEALETLEQAAAAWEEENLVSGKIKERTATMEIDGQQAVYHVDYLCEMDIASPRKLDVVFAENDK